MVLGVPRPNGAGDGRALLQAACKLAQLTPLAARCQKQSIWRWYPWGRSNLSKVFCGGCSCVGGCAHASGRAICKRRQRSICFWRCPRGPPLCECYDFASRRSESPAARASSQLCNCGHDLTQSIAEFVDLLECIGRPRALRRLSASLRAARINIHGIVGLLLIADTSPRVVNSIDALALVIIADATPWRWRTRLADLFVRQGAPSSHCFVKTDKILRLKTSLTEILRGEFWIQ